MLKIVLVNYYNESSAVIRVIYFLYLPNAFLRRSCFQIFSAEIIYSDGARPGILILSVPGLLAETFSVLLINSLHATLDI